MKRFVPLFALLITVAATTAAPLRAQVAAGNGAWVEGRFADAQAAYERELATNPQSVRSLYRLAVLASWAGRLDSAIALADRARGIEPDDADVLQLQALVLSWAGRLDASVAKYDTLLARDPTRREAALGRARALSWAGRLDEADAAYAALLDRDPRDAEALAGRAQVAAWRGDLARAASGYRAVLAQDSKNADALAGLGQVYHAQGRDAQARRQVAQALAVDSTNRLGRELDRTLRAGQQPQAETGADYTNDSDANTSWTVHASLAAALADRVRAFGSAQWARLTTGGLSPLASDVATQRSGGEVGLSVGVGPVQLTGAGGLRHVTTPPTAVLGGLEQSRTRGVARGIASVRAGSSTILGLGYSHEPFDETAALANNDILLDALDASLEATLPSGTSLSLGAGSMWVQDAGRGEDNRRLSGVVGITQTVARRFYVGALGRMLGYDDVHPACGCYFSPDRYTVGEVRGGWRLAQKDWDAGVSGGVGLQQVGKSADSQSEWHVEGRIARRFGPVGALELFGALTNSIAVTNTAGQISAGGYRYRSAGLRLRLGL